MHEFIIPYFAYHKYIKLCVLYIILYGLIHQVLNFALKAYHTHIHISEHTHTLKYSGCFQWNATYKQLTLSRHRDIYNSRINDPVAPFSYKFTSVYVHTTKYDPI